MALYGEKEGRYLQFRGSDSAFGWAPWNFDSFVAVFVDETVRHIAAFLNSKFVHDETPAVPCRIVYGVHTGTGLVQGIRLAKQLWHVECARLDEMVRARMERCILPLGRLPEPMNVKVSRGFRLEIKPLKDDTVLFVASIAFNDEYQLNRPCVLMDHGEPLIYYRDPCTMEVREGHGVYDEIMPFVDRMRMKKSMWMSIICSS